LPQHKIKDFEMVKFKKVKAVTRPLFKWVNGKERFFRIDSAMFIGKENKAAGDGKKMEAAHLCFVTDLESGEEGQIILGKVLQEIFKEQYPEDTYVGKAFSIVQNKVDGKGYNVYVVTEVEVEADEPVTNDANLPPLQASVEAHPEQGFYQSSQAEPEAVTSKKKGK
jgi:hypothetical protein